MKYGDAIYLKYLGDRSVAFFTTAPPERADSLAERLDADVEAVVPALGDRAALRHALPHDVTPEQVRGALPAVMRSGHIMHLRTRVFSDCHSYLG